MASADPEVMAVVLTGTGDYYCSGVDFVGSFPFPELPSRLQQFIEESNRKLFDAFIYFPKPLVLAANGPAIGASATSAMLCDDIVATPSCFLHTPFNALRILPEGCSSYWFEKRLGAGLARRLLERDEKVWAEELHRAGVVSEVVGQADLLDVAQRRAEEWVSSGQARRIIRLGERATLEIVNARESREIAQAFLGEGFLQAMENIASAKKKSGQAAVFRTLRVTRPVWSKL